MELEEAKNFLYECGRRVARGENGTRSITWFRYENLLAKTEARGTFYPAKPDRDYVEFVRTRRARFEANEARALENCFEPEETREE